MSGRPARARGLAWIFCYCGLWASVVAERVRVAARASLVAVADASKGPRVGAVSPGSLLLHLQ